MIKKNQPIKTEADGELDALTALADDYDEKHYPMEATEPLTAYEYCKRQGWIP